MSGAIAGAVIMGVTTLAATAYSASQQRKAASDAEELQMRALQQQQQAYAQQQQAAEKQLAAQTQQVETMQTANDIQAQSIANTEQETNRANAETVRAIADEPQDMRTNFTGGTGVNTSQYRLGDNNLLGYNDEEENGGSLFG